MVAKSGRHHWLFVNVDGNMPPLDEHLRFLDDKLAGYRIGAMAHAGALEFEIAANWKFVHENFIEPYHVFAAHPRLHTFVPMEERTPSFVEGCSRRPKSADKWCRSGLDVICEGRPSTH